LYNNKESNYCLCVFVCTRNCFEAGETLQLGIILYGTAIDYFMIVFAALEHLSEFMGIGKQRGRFYYQPHSAIN
jgi:hypothetical protein